LHHEVVVSVQFPRYICIHGHFYQPPRENPWLEAVEVQDSAAPYHDWNERITRECYGPNNRSRLLDGNGQIIGLSNNYAWMSFNFGPTLLEWMAENAADVLHGIVEGDRLSRQRRDGHGNALAQVYNHVILPLAGPRDQRTQVLWGIADFRKHFGREPEGMWLAETAADVASLEVLAAAGIRFTILAPRQAKRWRRLGETNWTEVPEGIDPSQAYLCRLPSGRSITLFFYDGAISRQVAFERLLNSGERFLARLMEGFDAGRQHAQLVHIATDGESYGHHHPHGDMALAYVLDRLSRNPEVRLTNYGEFLDLHPPEWEVEIHDNSSWSCVHGIERWRSNCGCNTGRGWQQEWRKPLREAFNRLKSRLDELFETRGREFFPDPWAARDGYCAVLLDRSDESVRGFLGRFAHPSLGPEQQTQALWLLEMQRHSQLMFTSCGWFFDEISGLETMQCLRYAGRALQLARHFDQDFEEEFVQILEQAPSNLPRYKNGRGVWEQLVRPAKVDLDRVLAHHAISLLYGSREVGARVYCYDLQMLDQEVRGRGDSHVAVGRMQVRSRLTWNEAETSFVVVHYGGLDFHAVLRRAGPAEEYTAFKERLLRTYTDGSLADVTELVLHEFEGDQHRLDDLFTEERRRVIGIVLQQRFADYQQTLERLTDQDEGVLTTLGRLQYPIPKAMILAASFTLDRQLLEEIAGLGANGGPAGVRRLLERGRAWGYRPAEPETLKQALEKELGTVFSGLSAETDFQAKAAGAEAILDAASLLGLSLDVWLAQNQLLNAYATLADSGALTPPIRAGFAHLADRLRVCRDLLGWRP
jgi:alpha-amylase/alpha-mannosidase (GH57 family)